MPVDTDRLQNAPLGSLLVLAARLAQQQWGGYLAAHHNLTPAGVAVLTTLGMHGGDLSHSRVAQACFFKPATLTGIVDTLEKSGHVQRRPIRTTGGPSGSPSPRRGGWRWSRSARSASSTRR